MVGQTGLLLFFFFLLAARVSGGVRVFPKNLGPALRLDRLQGERESRMSEMT